jgi:hypothetical protein
MKSFPIIGRILAESSSSAGEGSGAVTQFSVTDMQKSFASMFLDKTETLLSFSN